MEKRKQIRKKERPQLLSRALPLLIARELSQIEIAARLGVGSRTVSRWRHNELRDAIEAQWWSEYEQSRAQEEAERAADSERFLREMAARPMRRRKRSA